LLFVFGIVAAISPFPSGAVSKDFLSNAGFLKFKEKKRGSDFHMKDSDDDPARLDAFREKIVLLYFWTTW
jgi:hypothetical protein